jgi:cold-inducible RNA-binding protein
VKNLYVGNLAFSTTESDLREMFAPYGTVERVSLVTDRDTGRSCGFGFVEMANDTEAAAAISALNGKDAGGRALTVNEARPKTERGGGSGGRGGYRKGGGGGGGRDDYRGHARQPREPRW